MHRIETETTHQLVLKGYKTLPFTSFTNFFSLSHTIHSNFKHSPFIKKLKTQNSLLRAPYMTIFLSLLTENNISDFPGKKMNGQHNSIALDSVK
jgi:hypothetical protein